MSGAIAGNDACARAFARRQPERGAMACGSIRAPFGAKMTVLILEKVL
jgi:hypothetical protein